MSRYSKKSEELVEDTMHRMKKGKLKSGSGEKVTDQKQAVAIALSEARKKNYKVPAAKTSTKKKTSRSK
jgi:hypothetical protein